MNLKINEKLNSILEEMGGAEDVLVNAVLLHLSKRKRKEEHRQIYEQRDNLVTTCRLKEDHGMLLSTLCCCDDMEGSERCTFCEASKTINGSYP